MINWSEIELPIRPYVKALSEAGWISDSSCGHEMWVRIVCPLERQSELAAFVCEFINSKDIRIDRDYGWCGGIHATVHFPKPEGHGDGPHTHILLKVDPAAHPLYFVLRERRYESYSTDEHLRYLYDEGTCPTNWTSNIVAVIASGDEDPHGFATFVAYHEEPADFDEDAQVWSEIFHQLRSEE